MPDAAEISFIKMKHLAPNLALFCHSWSQAAASLFFLQPFISYKIPGGNIKLFFPYCGHAEKLLAVVEVRSSFSLLGSFSATCWVSFWDLNGPIITTLERINGELPARPPSTMRDGKRCDKMHGDPLKQVTGAATSPGACLSSQRTIVTGSYL